MKQINYAFCCFFLTFKIRFGLFENFGKSLKRPTLIYGSQTACKCLSCHHAVSGLVYFFSQRVNGTNPIKKLCLQKTSVNFVGFECEQHFFGQLDHYLKLA